MVRDRALSRRGFLAGTTAAVGATAGVSLLSACGSSSGASANGITTLNVVAMGVASPRWPQVLAAVNQKLAADKTGLALNIQWVSPASFLDKILLEVTSGESFDALLTAPWAHMQEFITDGAIIPIDSYLPKAPHLTAAIPSLVWKSNRFNGKTYGVPLMSSYTSYYGFMIRKDLRVKYGLAKPQTLAELEAFLYKVKANEKGMVPFGFNAQEQTQFDPYRWANEPWGYHSQTYNTNYNASFIDFRNGTSNPKVTDLWDYPGFIPMIQTHYRLVQDGIINSNSATQVTTDIDALFYDGKIAGEQVTTDGTLQPAQPMQVPGAEIELVYPFGTGPLPKPNASFQAWNFLAVHNSSPYPEKVVALSDWLSIKENHDLLEYGVQGTDWVADGSLKYVQKDQYQFPGYVISWRPTLERVASTMNPEVLSWYQWAQNPSNFTYDPFAPFLLDTTSVTSELEELASVTTQYLGPLILGLTEPTKGLAQLRSAFATAGYAKVQSIAQRQLTAFAATL